MSRGVLYKTKWERKSKIISMWNEIAEDKIKTKPQVEETTSRNILSEEIQKTPLSPVTPCSLLVYKVT